MCRHRLYLKILPSFQFKNKNYSNFEGMFVIRFILLPFSFLYGCVLSIRNWFFDIHIFPVTKVNAKVVSVGNLSVGGTGKTPHVEFLCIHSKKKYKTAILLRGYGRKTKGFLLVDEKSTIEEVGDEALSYALKFKDEVLVAVCEKRVEGAQALLALHPEIELIILDDAFQHRHIHRDCNILLTEFDRPYFKDYVMPIGRLREFRKGRKRADVVLVTKSPTLLSNEEKMAYQKHLKVGSSTQVFFSSIQYGKLISFSQKEELKYTPQEILLVTGIGNPKPLVNELEKKAKVTHLSFQDHHNYTVKDLDTIHKLFNNFVAAEKIIVTTEKDAMRLMNTEFSAQIEAYPWYYQEMTVIISEQETFLKSIYEDFITNE